MGHVYDRRTDRNWMRFFFGAAALFFFGAFMAWGRLAYDVVLSCDRGIDSCEAAELRNIGGGFIHFRLSEVKGAFVQIRRDGDGEISAECAVFNRIGREPLSFCGLPDDQVVHDFNAFLKDPGQLRYRALVRQGVMFGYIVAVVAVLLGLVPFVLGLLLLRRLHPRPPFSVLR